MQVSGIHQGERDLVNFDQYHRSIFGGWDVCRSRISFRVMIHTVISRSF